MGFFDFLSAPAQDPTLEDQALWKKKKTSPPAPESYQGNEALEVAQYNAKEANDKAKAENLKTIQGTSVENQRAADAQRGLAKDYDRAVTDAHVALQMADNPLRRDGPLSPDTVASIRLVQRAVQQKSAPPILADDFDRLSKNVEFNKEERDAFAGAAAMFRRSIKSREAMAVSPNAQRSVPSEEAIAAERAKIESLKRQEDAARQSMNALGYTNPQRQAAQNTIFALAKEREQAENNLKMFPSRSEVQPADAMSGDIKRGFSSAGVSPQQTAEAVNDGLKAVAESMGADFNPGDAVSFQYALPYAIQALGPEAQLAFSEWMRDIKKKEAEAKGFTPTGNPAQDAGGMQGEKPEGPTNQDLIRQNFEQQRIARAEFAAAQELQSWPAIIAFVVLGMLIGPQGAFAFFSNARRKRELQGWLQQLESERKYLVDEEDYRRSTEAETRKMAAARLQRKEDQNEAFRRQVGLKLMDHRLIIERNEKKGNPETALMKKLQASYQRATGMAAKYSGEMQNEFAPEDKRSAARANFNFYMKKAADLDMQLDELGGDVLEEGPEE